MGVGVGKLIRMTERMAVMVYMLSIENCNEEFGDDKCPIFSSSSVVNMPPDNDGRCLCIKRSQLFSKLFIEGGERPLLRQRQWCLRGLLQGHPFAPRRCLWRH